MENNNWATHPKTSDGQFACLDCKGSGKIQLLAWKNLPEEIRPCYGCKGTGYYVEYLLLKIGCERGQSSQYKNSFETLKKWVEANSTCKTCHGCQGKTPGGTDCEECGLVGTQPWGG